MTKANESTFHNPHSNLDRGTQTVRAVITVLDGFTEHRSGLVLVCCLGLQLRHQRVPSWRHERTFSST